MNDLFARRKELEEELRLAKTMPEKADIHQQLGIIWSKLTDPHKALYHHKKTLQCSKTNPSIISLRFIAEIYRNLNKLNKSIAYNQYHINLAKKFHLKLELYRGFCNIGITYLEKGEKDLKRDTEDETKTINYIDLALDSFDKSLKQLNELIEDQNKSISIPEENYDNKKEQVLEKLLICRNEALYNIGNAHSIKAQHDEKYLTETIKCFKLTIDSSMKTNDESTLGKCYNGLGILFMQMKDYTNSESYLKKDEKICKKRNDYALLVITLRNLGRLYQLLRKYELSNNMFAEAKRVCVEHLNNMDKNVIFDEIKNLKVEIVSNEKAITLKNQIFSIENKINSYSNSNDNNKLILYIKFNEELQEILIEKLENYNEAKIYVDRFLDKLNDLNSNKLSKIHLDININQIMGKFYYFLGICEDNLKDHEHAKIHFEQAINLFKTENLHQIPEKRYILLLIDYANILYHFKEEENRIEKLYWEAHILAEKIKNSHIINTCLNNLLYFYKKNKKINEINKIKKLLQEYDQSHHQSNENSESDISNDSLNLDPDDCEILCSFEKKVNLFDNSGKTAKVVMPNSKANQIYRDNEIEIEYYPRIKNNEPIPEFFFPFDMLEKKNRFENNHSNAIIAQKIKDITSKQNKKLENIRHKPEKIYTDLINAYQLCGMKNVYDNLNSAIFDIKNQFINDINMEIIIKSLLYNDQMQQISLKNNRASCKTVKAWNKIFESEDNENYFNLIKLNFSGNPLNAKNDVNDFTRFLHSLSRLKCIQYLNLSYIIIDKKLQAKLFESLNSCHQLVILKLKGCSIYDLRQYKPSQLQKLNLENNQLIHVALLITNLHDSLTYLDISSQNQQYYNAKTHNEVNMDDQYIVDTIKKWQLKKLKMCNNDLIYMSELNKNITFHKLIQNLITLDISGCKNLHKAFQNLTDIAFDNRFNGVNVEFKLRKFIFKNSDLSLPNEREIILKFLPLLQDLEKLDLSNSNIDETYQTILLDNLMVFNLHLQKLILYGWYNIPQDKIDQLHKSLNLLETPEL